MVTPDTSGAPLAPPSWLYLAEGKWEKQSSVDYYSRIPIYMVKRKNWPLDSWRVFFFFCSHLLFTMDDPFFKSALPAHDSSVLDDTSLALPAYLRSSTQPDEDRNQRVHRQVQLTMSRKSKKTQSNGNVHFENESASYFDAFGRNRVHCKPS